MSINLELNQYLLRNTLYYLLMSSESEIQADIDALRTRCSDTKDLYREVCALLFFRYGVTPTASKLYQHVRKGSMSAPAEALAKFWEELRTRARVEIDHPGLPETLKEAAGQAVNALWSQATELAREELSALRVEASTQAQDAQRDLQELRQRHAELESRFQAGWTQISDAEQHLQNMRAELEQERREHAACAARADTLSRQVDELKLEQSRSRQHFSAELEKGRAAVDEAIQRATESEHRALREIDRERTSRSQADKLVEQLRSALAAAEREHHAKLMEANASLARMTADLEGARTSQAQTTIANRAQGIELQQALQAAAQYKAESETLRALVTQFQPALKPIRKKRGQDALGSP